MILTSMKKIKYFIIALCILGSCNEKSNEDMFFSELSDIVEDETCRIGQNRKAIDKVLKLIKDNPASLDYQIRPLETDGINRECLIEIITSDDGNVRVYNVGNTASCSRNPSLSPDVSWIIQYRIDGAVYTDVWYDKHSSVTDIYSVQNSTKIYYLFSDYSDCIREKVFMDERITAYSINPKTFKFQEERLFKTTREFLPNINISWIDCDYAGDKMIYSELHHIYCNNGELRIPLVTINGIMTEGYLLYLWNGEFFKFIGVDPIAEFKVKDFTIRIEILSDGKYKYSSWGKNKSTCMTPDLVLYNGEMMCWDETGICDCNAVYDNGSSSLLGRRYSFKNNGYLYCFEYGWWKGYFREYFIISKGKEEILSAEIENFRVNEYNL